MRSWSISVGRLFGVDVRIHLTFLILPMFVFGRIMRRTSKAPTGLATSLWSGSFWLVWQRTNADTSSPPAASA